MWTYRSEQLASDHTIWIALDHDTNAVTFNDALRLWQVDPGFRSFFNSVLAAAPFSEFRWETPPLSAATANRPFEFVLINSPGLDRPPDDSVFHEHFLGKTKDEVVEFPNSGKDAILIAPCPIGASLAYGHLAAFVREAPESQQHALWNQVGATMKRRLSTKPVWLSTAGAGVPWLHVRLDDRPKYYRHAPYRQSDELVFHPDSFT